MKSKLKLIILIVCISFILIVGICSIRKILEKTEKQEKLIPTVTKSQEYSAEDKIWVGTFQIAWNEFMDTKVGGNIEFVDGESELCKKLNKRIFTKDMLSSDDYYIKIGETSNKLKNEIANDIEKKFEIENSEVLEQIDFDENRNGYIIYAMLYKKFRFLKNFDRLYPKAFNGSEENVRYFGISSASSDNLNKNVEILFYNNETDFAVLLKTVENEEIILYCNDSNGQLENLYNEIKLKTDWYKGNNAFEKNDVLAVPYISINTNINYSELCYRDIKGTDGLYITNAIQNIKFSLDETGGDLISEAEIRSEYKSAKRNFIFDKPFLLFLKESDKDVPYFAIKVDNTDILVKVKNEGNE